MVSEPGQRDRMPIGMFSRASSISVRTLRNYHEQGLLVPAAIDPTTGYRYYTVDQLTDALAIVRLRDLQVPLAKVHEILRRRDPGFTATLLASHRTTMEEQLREAERIVSLLDQDISTLATPVHLITTEPRTILSCRADVAVAAVWDWIGRTVDRLYDVAGERAHPADPPGALYVPELSEDDHETVTALVPLSEAFLVPASAADVEIGYLPAVGAAVLSHTDGFDTIADTYRLLGAWIARNATAHGTAPVREWYRALAPGRPPSGRAGLSDAVAIHWPLGPGATG
jgi:DNA-binding transcriptional MerR regulator